MYLFLVPLLIGFFFNWASAFTGFYVRWLGETSGQAVSFLLRNILGIPVWAAGLVMACRISTAPLFPASAFAAVLGWLLIGAGALLILWALALLGWRSFRPTSSDTLISRGIYRRIRHPIHSGVLLELFGLALLFPTAPVMLACLLGYAYVVIQSRLEEADLISRMPAYRDYMERVPRFLPRIGNHPSARE